MKRNQHGEEGGIYGPPNDMSTNSMNSIDPPTHSPTIANIVGRPLGALVSLCSLLLMTFSSAGVSSTSRLYPFGPFCSEPSSNVGGSLLCLRMCAS